MHLKKVGRPTLLRSEKYIAINNLYSVLLSRQISITAWKETQPFGLKKQIIHK